MRHRLEYVAVRAVLAFIRVLPFGVVEWLGQAIGWMFYVCDRPHRRVAEANVAAAFPTRTPTDRRAIVRGAFAHFGRLLFGLLKFSTLSREAMLARVEFDGDERVRLAHARGRGIIFVTGHFGFWEIQALVHALRLPPMAVLARTLDNRRLNALLEALRTSTGNSVIYKEGAMRRVLRRLQGGESVGILIDQHVLSREAITTTFFDRPAATTPAVAALAFRTGAAVIPLFALPLGGGRYRMVYEPPIEAPDSTSPDAIQAFTQRCTDVLEMYVRRHPTLWLWMHRRWRSEA